MTELDAILIPEWKELVKVASEWEYGSTHSHEEIAAIIKIPYGTPKYYQNVTTAMEELIAMWKRMTNIYKEGYYVLKPGEHTPAVAFDVRASLHKMRKGISNWHDSPVSKMNDTERKTHERVGVSACNVFSTFANGYNEIAQIAGIQRKQKVLLAASEKKQHRED